MSSPVTSVGEDTEPVEIAKLLAFHHIKRVPVVRERREAQHKRADRDSVAEQRHPRIVALINEHICDPSWRQLLHYAREAAEGGDREFMLLRFPSGLCSDGGRAINSEPPGWPQTLRGEAAEFCTRWEQDLKPQGFPITARVHDFPDGMPGDIGLFLDWGA